MQELKIVRRAARGDEDPEQICQPTELGEGPHQNESQQARLREQKEPSIVHFLYIMIIDIKKVNF